MKEANFVFEYPRQVGRVTHLTVDLECVRASDGIRVSYDFDRDGWVIEQPTRLSWPADDEACDPGWTEVAFVESWAQNEDDSVREGK